MNDRSASGPLRNNRKSAAPHSRDAALKLESQLLRRSEVFLADAAQGAGPVVREFFEGSSGGDAVVGIADSGIILVPSDAANIFFHICPI